MRDTYTSLYYHIVFSTKERKNLITPEVESRLYPYLSAIFKSYRVQTIRINGTPNHVHILLNAQTADFNISDIMREVKEKLK